MTNEEMQIKIAEIHTDVRWLKEQHKEHLAAHAKYMYFLVITAIGAFIGLFK